MEICSKCLNNNWTFRKIEGYITAQCVICTHEVMFKAYKKKPMEFKKKIKKVQKEKTRTTKGKFHVGVTRGIEAQKEETEAVKRRKMFKQAVGLKNETKH